MFSQTAEYALRVIVFLATLKDRPATTRQIAAATRVPIGYLSKVVQSLSRAKLVVSQRGLHGGTTLARPAHEISGYDVITAVGSLPRITTCPLKLESHDTHLCALHRRLDDAVAMVETALKKSTIAEMLADTTGSIPLGELGTNAAAATYVAERVFPVRARKNNWKGR